MRNHVGPRISLPLAALCHCSTVSKQARMTADDSLMGALFNKVRQPIDRAIVGEHKLLQCNCFDDSGGGTEAPKRFMSPAELFKNNPDKLQRQSPCFTTGIYFVALCIMLAQVALIAMVVACFDGDTTISWLMSAAISIAAAWFQEPIKVAVKVVLMVCAERMLSLLRSKAEDKHQGLRVGTRVVQSLHAMAVVNATAKAPNTTEDDMEATDFVDEEQAGSLESPAIAPDNGAESVVGMGGPTTRRVQARWEAAADNGAGDGSAHFSGRRFRARFQSAAEMSLARTEAKLQEKFNASKSPPKLPWSERGHAERPGAADADESDLTRDERYKRRRGRKKKKVLQVKQQQQTGTRSTANRRNAEKQQPWRSTGTKSKATVTDESNEVRGPSQTRLPQPASYSRPARPRRTVVKTAFEQKLEAAAAEQRRQSSRPADADATPWSQRGHLERRSSPRPSG
eukprot:SAG22_NODE_545_length_9265_cov_7.988108_2_plen_456_part_00